MLIAVDKHQGAFLVLPDIFVTLPTVMSLTVIVWAMQTQQKGGCIICCVRSREHEIVLKYKCISIIHELA